MTTYPFVCMLVDHHNKFQRMNSLSQAVAEVLHRKSCFLNQPGKTEMFCLVYPETAANCWDTHTPTPTAGNIHLLYGIWVFWMDGCMDGKEAISLFFW